MSYVAFRLTQNGASKPWGPKIGNGSEWDEKARAAGVLVDTSPAVGSVAQWDGGLGHVAYVEEVGRTYIVVSEDAYLSDTSGYSATRRIEMSSTTYTRAEFIHVRDVGSTAAAPAKPSSGAAVTGDPRQYIGKLVQWDGDTNPQPAAWLVTGGASPGRVWVPDGGIWNCLVESGAPNAGRQPSQTLDRLPDRAGTSATCGRDWLNLDETLYGPSNLSSTNGRYKLYLQGDGNLVLYDKGDANRVLWTTNKMGGSYLAMQGDGNIVVHGKDGSPIWASNTAGSGARYLVLQDDGNLVAYAGDNRTNPKWSSNSGPVGATTPAAGDPRQYIGKLVQWDGDTNPQPAAWLVTGGASPGRVWVPDGGIWNCLVGSGASNAGKLSSQTLDAMPDRTGIHAMCGRDWLNRNENLYGPSNLSSTNGRFKLYLQGDGNLVLYDKGDANRVLWATNKMGGSYLAMQGDSNVVVYNKAGAPIWASNTVGSGARYLVLQDDGNLVAYAGDNRTNPKWSSNTGGH